ncbi:hypothetical protein CYMTET_49018, partial [Cymbomonas tetramitiformis]
MDVGKRLPRQDAVLPGKQGRLVWSRASDAEQSTSASTTSEESENLRPNSWFATFEWSKFPKVQWAWLAQLSSLPSGSGSLSRKQLRALRYYLQKSMRRLRKRSKASAAEAVLESPSKPELNTDPEAENTNPEILALDQAASASRLRHRDDADRLPDELHYVRVPETSWDIAL